MTIPWQLHFVRLWLLRIKLYFSSSSFARMLIFLTLLCSARRSEWVECCRNLSKDDSADDESVAAQREALSLDTTVLLLRKCLTKWRRRCRSFRLTTRESDSPIASTAFGTKVMKGAVVDDSIFHSSSTVDSNYKFQTWERFTMAKPWRWTMDDDQRRKTTRKQRKLWDKGAWGSTTIQIIITKL